MFLQGARSHFIVSTSFKLYEHHLLHPENEHSGQSDEDLKYMYCSEFGMILSMEPIFGLIIIMEAEVASCMNNY